MFVSQAVQVLARQPDDRRLPHRLRGARRRRESASSGSEAAGNELLGFELFGERLELTAELLRVAAGLAAFSGFYFSIAIFTDSTYRQEFLEELTSEMRESFSERAEYLRLRERLGAARRAESATIGG